MDIHVYSNYSKQSNSSELTKNITWKGSFSLNYSDPIAIALSIIFAILIAWTLIGNLLVWIALLKFKPLQTINNYFIGNLAISDFLLASTVLPMSAANDVLGYWIFGKNMCMIWLSIDVLYCTASIWSLCIIGIDRYTATIHPIWYRRTQSVRNVGLYIAGAWVFSIIVCIPPLILWDSNPSEGYQYNNATETFQCILFTSPGYVVYSASGSFLIPFFLIFYLYIRIFIKLQQLSRRLNQNRDLFHEPSFDTSGGNDNSPTAISPNQDNAFDSSSYNTSIKLNKRKDSHNSAAENDSRSENPAVRPCTEKEGMQDNDNNHNANICKITEKSQKLQLPETSKADAPNGVPNGRRKSERSVQPSPVRIMLNILKRPSRSQNSHHRMNRFMRRESRATKRMAIIVTCFIGSWLPFFFMYVIRSFCDHCHWNHEVVLFIIWLGYVNSGINPILYTVFNNDFRQAFQQLLCCGRFVNRNIIRRF